MNSNIDQAALRRVVAELAFMEPEEIGEATPLFSGGIIDSVSLLEIVVYLEKTYGIKVTGSELALENFDSISNICSFIARKTA